MPFLVFQLLVGFLLDQDIGYVFIFISKVVNTGFRFLIEISDLGGKLTIYTDLECRLNGVKGKALQFSDS